VILAAIGQLLLGQEAKDTKFRGRLPAHYGDIVSEAQRLQIYAVQEKYARQIDELKLKLELLESQRDREIENVLSAEQKARLKKVQDQAAAQRRKKSADAKAAEEGKVSVPTAAKTAKK
jgi:DNA-binding protein H-NS